MAKTNPERGDQVVMLGSLGEVNLRPSFRALSSIDDPKGGGPITSVVQRFMLSPSLNDVTTCIYQMHLDGENPKTFKYDEIGEAVMSVGMTEFFDSISDLLATAWGPEKAPEKDGEPDPGKDPAAHLGEESSHN